MKSEFKIIAFTNDPDFSILLATECNKYGFLLSFIDNVDEVLTPTCNPQSGSVFPIGTTTVICTATDSAGNASTNSFTVTINYEGFVIPDWLKNVAWFWHSGYVDDDSFLEAIQYLIQNEIIIVSSTGTGTGTGGAIPDWVKNVAGWWASDQIDDETFANSLTYLIEIGLIQVS